MNRNDIHRKMAKLEILLKAICTRCNARGNPNHLNRVLGDLFDSHEEMIIKLRTAR